MSQLDVLQSALGHGASVRFPDRPSDQASREAGEAIAVRRLPPEPSSRTYLPPWGLRSDETPPGGSGPARRIDAGGVTLSDGGPVYAFKTIPIPASRNKRADVDAAQKADDETQAEKADASPFAARNPADDAPSAAGFSLSASPDRSDFLDQSHPALARRFTQAASRRYGPAAYSSARLGTDGDHPVSPFSAEI